MTSSLAEGSLCNLFILKAKHVQNPNHQRWYAKWKFSWNTGMYILHTCFCTFGADLHAQSMLINKASASELSRKFIKSALLLVGIVVQITYSKVMCVRVRKGESERERENWIYRKVVLHTLFSPSRSSLPFTCCHFPPFPPFTFLFSSVSLFLGIRVRFMSGWQVFLSFPLSPSPFISFREGWIAHFHSLVAAL